MDLRRAHRRGHRDEPGGVRSGVPGDGGRGRILTSAPGRALRAVVVLVTVVATGAGCVTYPAITDIGGTRIRPENGRLTRQPDGAVLSVDLHSTGKYGDVLTDVRAPVAGRTVLVGPTSAPVDRIEIPGAAVVVFRPGGPHVRLTDLTRALTPGEVVIVTLVFEKTGNVGVVSVVE